MTTRQKEIQYASRTRAATDHFERVQEVRHALVKLLPTSRRGSLSQEEMSLLHEVADLKVYNLVDLVYSAKDYEGHTKDYEFSRLTMREHWRAGLEDARRSLAHAEISSGPPIDPASRSSGLRSAASDCSRACA